MIYNIFKSNNFDVRLVGNIGISSIRKRNIKKEQYLLLRHLLIKYHIVNILKLIMALF